MEQWNDADGIGAIGVGGAAEQGIDGGPRPVLPRPPRKFDMQITQQHVAVGRRHIDPPRPHRLAIPGKAGPMAVDLAEDRWQQAVARADMQHNHQRNGKWSL